MYHKLAEIKLWEANTIIEVKHDGATIARYVVLKIPERISSY